MKAVFAFSLSLFLVAIGAAGAAPSPVYSTYLGTEGGDFISDVAVDSAGNAYVLGWFDSPDLGYSLAKLSPQGELIFLRRLEMPSRAPRALAVGPAGHVYVAGTANRSETGAEANEGFVTRLGPEGRGWFYDTFFSDGENTQAVDLAVDSRGQAYVHVLSDYASFSSVSRFSPEGSLNGGAGGGSHHVTAMALGPAGDLFTVGWTEGQVILQRIDASGALVETVLDESGTVYPQDIAGVPGGGSVVVGASSLGLHAARYDAAGEEVFFRALGVGALEVRDVAVTSSGEIVIAGVTSSGSPVDALVLRLDGGTGELISSMTLGGSGNDQAHAVAAGPEGDVYVAGTTYSPDFPTVDPLHPLRGTSDGFVARISENQPPDCSAATASPSVIWPPNGKMVPVSIQGLDGLRVEITAIHQDEPLTGSGPDAAGLGTSSASVRAARSGGGDGRVYRLTFRAAGPEGSSCTGEVTVCVPHDRRAAACGDGGAAVDSTLPSPRSSALLWSTWLGGSADELKLADLEVDASGFAWIAGTTASKDYTGILDHPQEDETFFLDAFASRLDPAGRLDHSRVLGQPYEDEHIEGLAIGPGGAVSLTGFMDNFGDHDVIATQIRADGTGGGFAYYIGENNHEFSTSVATDRTGNVYIVGTGSRFFPGFGGDFEGGAYVLKLGPNHDFVDLFPLGEAAGRPSAVAVDPAGNIHVAGEDREMRVAKLDPAGNLLWSIRLGGSRAAAATALKVDAAGRVWVAGWTDSPDFPVRGGRPYAGGRDAFLVRLTPGGEIDLSTLLGGAGDDEAHDLALDAQGRPYLAGLTGSADFPLAGAPRGGTDAFAASFGLTGPASLTLSFALRLGGGSSDEAYGVAVDPVGTILWIAGLTRSADFPVLNPWQPALAGGADAFVAKVALGR